MTAPSNRPGLAVLVETLWRTRGHEIESAARNGYVWTERAQVLLNLGHTLLCAREAGVVSEAAAATLVVELEVAIQAQLDSARPPLLSWLDGNLTLTTAQGNYTNMDGEVPQASPSIPIPIPEQKP